MAKYRKKPIVIEAVQWLDDGDHDAVMSAVKRHDGVIFCHDHICVDGGAGYTRTFAIPTLDGSHEVTPGDWIITGVQGEHYPCKPEIFAATYEEV